MYVVKFFRQGHFSHWVVPENIHTNPPPPHPTEGIFVLDPYPLGFPFQGVLVIPPTPPPGISVIFQHDWVPSGKSICVKNIVALHYYAKDNFFCDLMRKNLFIHVNMVSRRS